MKQQEMFAKAKSRYCCWLLLFSEAPGIYPRECKRPAVVTIHKAAYCSEHAEKAIKLFGAGKPITT